MAVSLHRMRDFCSSLHLWREILSVQKTALLPDHGDIIAVQHSLAIVYWEGGDPSKAISLLEYLIRSHKNNPLTLTYKHELAVSFQAHGSTKKAIELLEDIVQL